MAREVFPEADFHCFDVERVTTGPESRTCALAIDDSITKFLLISGLNQIRY